MGKQNDLGHFTNGKVIGGTPATSPSINTFYANNILKTISGHDISKQPFEKNGIVNLYWCGLLLVLSILNVRITEVILLSFTFD